MGIVKSFLDAIQRSKERGWDRIYILIDIHGTIFKPSYSLSPESYEYYPFARETLRILSSQDFFKIILWSSSYLSALLDYVDVLERDRIRIDWLNENPEVKDTEFQCFGSKFYFNVGIDDKFGFDPEKDWQELYRFFIINGRNR